MNTLAPLDLVSLLTVLLAMVILAVISRLYNQSWLEPGSFFLVVWFGFIVLPLIMAPENPIYPFSIWYIFSFAVAILLGAAVWNKLDPATRLGKALTMGVPLDRYANILFNFTLVFTAISIVGVGVLIFSGMGRYNLTFDLFSLSSLPNLFYVDRDTGIFTLSWSVKGLMYLVYTAALLGGITYRFQQEWKRFLCLLPLIIAFGGMVGGLSEPVYEFKKYLTTHFNCHFIFIKDRYQCWYFKGIYGLGHNFTKSVKRLKKLISKIKYSKIITLGTSAGGYAAILFGILLISFFLNSY